MLDGYPLREYEWKDWVFMIVSSSLILQVVFSVIGANLAPILLSLSSEGSVTFEGLQQILVSATVTGAIASLPITLFVIYKRKIPLFNRKQLSKKESFLIRGISKKDWKFMLGYIPASYFLYLIGQIILINLFDPGQPVNQIAIESLFDYLPMWQLFLMIVVVAPITEELLFRGMFLFPGESLEVSWVRVIISALFFGIVHTPTDIFSFYTYVGMGFIFAYAAKRTESIEVAIVYHFLNNLVGFIQILALRQFIG